MDTDDTVADQTDEAMASVLARSLNRKHDGLSLAPVAAEGRWDDVLAMIESATMATVDLDAVSELGRTALWPAAKEGHAAVVQALLQAGADVNKADDDGDASLSVAASAAIATMLIERGSHLNATNKLGQTALWRAAKEGRAGVAQALLQAGAEVNKASERGNAPLSVAASAPIATMLIERGADVNATNRFGATALLLAAAEDRTDVVEALLQADADVNKADEDDDAPLSMAASAPIATMLIEHSADVNATNKLGRTALWCAALQDRADVVEVLLRAGGDVNQADEDGDAPLSMAASAPIAAMLIERGADVNATNRFGATALLYAAEGGCAGVVEALLRAGADVNKADEDGDAPLRVAASAPIATMLIERGADVNATNKLGRTALWRAALQDRADLVEALLQAGADVNKADEDGDAPLRMAASAPIATILIERGADLNASNRFGETALLLAALQDRADVVVALLQAGADVKKASEVGNAPLSAAASALAVAMLIERGADVNASNRCGGTALRFAAERGDTDVVEALLQAGADVSKADEDGFTPLNVAANAPIATMLIERGADVNAANKLGETALWRAVKGGRADVVEALLQAGADVNKADRSGRTPLTVAADERRWSFVTLLARLSRLANVDALNSDGKTALWVALDCDEPEVRKAAIALICGGADVDFQCNGVSLLRSVAQRSADNVLLLLAAGATTAGVSAVDCCDRDVMALMMAGGVVWTELEIEQAIRRFGEDDDDNSDSDDNGDDGDERFMVTLAEILNQVPAAKKRIERAGFAAIRARVLEISNAMQQLEIPAPQLIEIVTQACAPFAAQLPYHYLWDAVVLVKHFHSRGAK
jgi:serine/threonine-protein phosphatase 6 regulatory ankyrin repeat subunit B